MPLNTFWIPLVDHENNIDPTDVEKNLKFSIKPEIKENKFSGMFLSKSVMKEKEVRDKIDL